MTSFVAAFPKRTHKYYRLVGLALCCLSLILASRRVPSTRGRTIAPTFPINIWFLGIKGVPHSSLWSFTANNRHPFSKSGHWCFWCSGTCRHLIVRVWDILNQKKPSDLTDAGSKSIKPWLDPWWSSVLVICRKHSNIIKLPLHSCLFVFHNSFLYHAIYGAKFYGF